MSETMIDEIPPSSMPELDPTGKESAVHNDDDDSWLHRNNQSKNNEMIDGTAALSIDEITTEEMNAREKPRTSFIPDGDDSDDDDDIQITIGNYEPQVSTFQTNRPKNRPMLPTNQMLGAKASAVHGVDFEAQGMINGQPTFEHDIANAYKDEEKPWKKPGADISDYFNYGFTEETWAQYCDRQRRLRAENNIARLNIPHMPPMMAGHPPMGHPMNPHSMMMMNRPMNMQMIPRTMNVRRPDGKIGVIGTTDQTSRRTMLEPPNNFEHPSFINGSSFPASQPPNGQTVGDLIATPSGTNGHPSTHGAPPNNVHHMPPLGGHRLSLISVQPGMQFRPQFAHPHALGGPQFFPRGSMGGMHGDRPPQPYFMPHRPQQPWDNRAAVPPQHGFHPGPAPSQTPTPAPANNERRPSSRSATPENRSPRSATPEENRATTTAAGQNDRSTKEDRYKEREGRDHHSSSRHSSYRSYHRSSEHEYERPRNDRKSSRDRDEKYERHSRKRHHRDDRDRHSSSHRTPTKTTSSASESSQPLNNPSEPPVFDSQSSRHDDSERSSSRHSHHKKSSKRSRHDSGDDRSSNRHRRSSEKSKKKSAETVSDVKQPPNE